MDISRKSCRLCLTETDFNVSLFGNYCRRTNMIDKILVCLKLVIEDTDLLDTICYRCAENVERYHDFMFSIKKCQMQYSKENCRDVRRPSMDSPAEIKRHVTSYVREQVYDADYTFSFLEIPNEEKVDPNHASSPFFSYFSPPSMMKTKEPKWKTPKTCDSPKKDVRDKYKKVCKSGRAPRHHSRDLFESQSQDVEDLEPKTLNWNLTPDDNIIKRVRQKCFGQSDF